eukprot:scaffold1771_cov211-Alexandrium_tamarense.AAC.3
MEVPSSTSYVSYDGATNWKNADNDVLEYVTEVARMIKERRDELQVSRHELLVSLLLQSYEPDADEFVLADDNFRQAISDEVPMLISSTTLFDGRVSCCQVQIIPDSAVSEANRNIRVVDVSDVAIGPKQWF